MIGHILGQMINVLPYFTLIDDVVGRNDEKLDENCLSEWESNPPPSEQLQPMTIKTTG